MNDQTLLKFLQDQIIEMEKYKWCLGVELNHDPLNDKTLNEIYCEWIQKNGEEFRKRWENNCGNN